MISIKNLTWERFGDTNRIASTNVGKYCIWPTYNGAMSYSTFNRSKVTHANIAEAENYCQQDFEQLILSNIKQSI